MTAKALSGMQWFHDCANTKSGFTSAKIFRLLQDYQHATLAMDLALARAENLAERLRALRGVVDECDTLEKATRDFGVRALLFNYRSACTKRMKAIESSPKHWNTAKMIFAPSYAGGNPAQRLRFNRVAVMLHAKEVVAATEKEPAQLDISMWLEKLDPNHHSWRLDGLKALYLEWEKDDATSLNLWDWLGHKGTKDAGDLQERIIYLAPEDQLMNACDIDKDGLVRRLPVSVGGVGEPISTLAQNHVKTQYYQPEFWAYVISTSHKLYIRHHEGNRFHHSSFLGGARVLGAGMIGVSKGQIVYINNKSGHYKPSPAQLYTSLNALKGHYPALDFGKIAIEILDDKHDSYMAWGHDFLAAKGNYEAFVGPFNTTNNADDDGGWLLRVCKQIIEKGDTWAGVPEAFELKARIQNPVAIKAQRDAAAAATALATAQAAEAADANAAEVAETNSPEAIELRWMSPDNKKMRASAVVNSAKWHRLRALGGQDYQEARHLFYDLND